MKPAIRNGNRSGLEYLGLSGITPLPSNRPWSIETNRYFPYSSARDQLVHRTVAVKKLAEPFKTPAIARHMFREIKLLRQLRHENVRLPMASMKSLSNCPPDHQPDRYLHFSLWRHVRRDYPLFTWIESTNNVRYLVTELMATDLNTILKAKRVENQFVQYFMYQIMVGAIYTNPPASTIFWPSTIPAWSKISPLSRCHPSRSKAKQHLG